MAKVMFESRYFERSRPEILALVPKDARCVLDVGCGAGWLGKALKKNAAVEVHGIEIMERPARRASQVLDKVWIGPVEEVVDELEPERYDCIVLADVLEHLRDPHGVLRKLAAKLSPLGTVVCSIPNVQNLEVLLNLWAGRWNYTSEGLLDRTHVRFFTRQTVRELFWAAGLRMEKMETVKDERITQMFSNGLQKGPRRRLFFSDGCRDFSVWQFLVTGRRLEAAPSAGKTGFIIRTRDAAESAVIMNKLFQGRRRVPEPAWLVPMPNTLPSLGELQALCGDVTDVDFIWVLDARATMGSDCLDAIQRISALAPEIGVFVPGVYVDAEFQELIGIGFRWCYSGLFFELVGRGDGAGQWPDPVCVDSALPHALAIRGDVFKRVGGFDGKFQGKWQIHDFCIRAAHAGYLSAYVPDAKVWVPCDHAELLTETPEALYEEILGRLFWAERHGSRMEWFETLCQEAVRAFNALVPKFFWIAYEMDGWLKRMWWQMLTWRRSFDRNLSNPKKRARLKALKAYAMRRFPVGQSGRHSAKASLNP